MQSEIPHEAQVTSEVNLEAPTVTLYDPTGKAIQVSQVDKAYWLGQGFTETQLDPDSALDDLETQAGAVVDYMAQLVEETRGMGKMATHEGSNSHLAQQEMAKLTQTFNRLLQALHLTYPIAEAEPTKLVRVNESGDEESTFVDPAQVDLYVEKGWHEA